MSPHHPRGLTRRQWLMGVTTGAAGAAGAPSAASAAAVQPPGAQATDAAEPGTSAARLALAWADADGTHWAGALSAAADTAVASMAWRTRLPGRPHGLLALPGGGLLVVAVRPGRWLLRLDAAGQPQAQAGLPDDDPATLDGHAILGANGGELHCSATDTRSGQGLIDIRNAQTLAPLGRIASGGIEPHQLLADPLEPGTVWIAHGGIGRDASGRKRDVAAMDSCLTRLALASGHTEHWRLPDRRLSLRHLALLPQSAGRGSWVGVAMQAEHDSEAERAAAPVLACLEPQAERLRTVPECAQMAGYAADIATASDGFVISAPRAHRALHWHPEQGCTPAAALRQAGALAAEGGSQSAAWLCAERGLGRWHRQQPARLWAWPGPLALDNHAVVMRG